MPAFLQTKIDKVLNPAQQDDIIVVTRGTADDQEAKLAATLSN